jgi:cellulose synthase/poly-beta-1,6-N-acetylglucosamine synthase-like glycosyltransferase
MTDLAIDILGAVQWVILAYFLIINCVLTALLVSAARELRCHRLEVWREGSWRLLGSEVAPRVSVLAPAYNEGVTVTASVRSLLSLQYPNLEVVVVNDGSTDETLATLARDFDLVSIRPVQQRGIETAAVRGIYRSREHPGLVVVDKVNGGKADALNAGLGVARGELVCAIDADTIIQTDALLRMVRPFLAGPDVIAAGGTIRVVNGSRVAAGRVVAEHAPYRALPGFQAVEYLRAFLTGRLGWNRLGGNLVISGAFGLFRRDATIAAGGYEHETVGEDMELVARMRRHARSAGRPDRVSFIPDPVAWTEVPESLRSLGRQRDRWHRGLADVLWRHRVMVLNPRFGVLGMFVVPYFLFIELLAPVVEAAGLLLLVLALVVGAVDAQFAVLFLAVAYGYGFLLTLYATVLDEWTYRGYGGLRERLVLLGFGLVEGLGYRQLTVIWRLRGLWSFMRGNREWGQMARAGFKPEQGAA